MIIRHLRVNERQLNRVINNMPKNQAGRENGFPIPDSGNQSPYVSARFTGNHLVLLRLEKDGRTTECGVKLNQGQQRALFGELVLR